MELSGKLETFGLGENPALGRKYILTSVNFGLLRTYFHVRVYDPVTQEGEQRVARERHISKLKNAISNEQYTPASFNACVADLSQVDVSPKGLVKITLSEDSKLPLLDGGSRFRALELLRQEGDVKLARKVENLPIPIIIYLDPEKSKTDFTNLQMGLPVSRSQLLSMKIANGQVREEKQPIFNVADKIVHGLHMNENSPFYGQVNFGQTTDGKLSYQTLLSDRAADVITSLYGSAAICLLQEKDPSWFVDALHQMIDYVKEHTGATAKGKLLELPPEGAKGCVHNLIGATNVWEYYKFLKGDICETDYSLLNDALQVYDDNINKDLSSRRKVTLMCAFTQRLFQDLLEDPECPTGSHMGIPISLLVLTRGGSSFGVENPPNITPGRGGRSKHLVTTPVENTTLPSDTDEEFLK